MNFQTIVITMTLLSAGIACQGLFSNIFGNIGSMIDSLTSAITRPLLTSMTQYSKLDKGPEYRPSNRHEIFGTVSTTTALNQNNQIPTTQQPTSTAAVEQKDNTKLNVETTTQQITTESTTSTESSTGVTTTDPSG
ncbi:uncharacterized protein [Musca autumnalis]|uniref:uncharacterized protein n=1 Tax=Musca autumnalis TaxID=221902 RepID=UPI003CEA3BEB